MNRDFFISYNRNDRQNAEWIAWVLEEAGYTTVIQAWDFGAGGNFVQAMNEAAQSADRTIAVLSPTYLASSFCQPEWMAAFAADPTNVHHKLIPVRVEECELTGLLGQIVYIDLVGKDEATAQETLLAQIRVSERAKPTQRPAFQASRADSPPKPSPKSATGNAPVPERPAFPTATRVCWSVPYTRNAFFTGREQDLQALHDALTGSGKTSVLHVLTGLGGVGKTQLALEYAFQHRNDYSSIFWGRAGTEHELLTDFIAIATVLELPGKNAQDPLQTRDAVKEWLAQNGGWLLILNNVTTAASVKPFLPTIHEGRILITSRSQDMRALGVVKPQQLGQLSDDEAAAFLLRSTGREQADPDEIAAAQELGHELGGLPLALEQAAAYIQEKDTRFQNYLKSFRRRRLTLLDSHLPETGDYQQSVTTTWDISMEAVRASSPASLEILNLSGFLAADRIPVELLVRAASQLGETLSEALEMAGEDELVVDDLLEPLSRYSLIRRSSKTESFDVHRLVQEVIRNRMDDETRRHWAETAVRAVHKAFPDLAFKNWADMQRLLPHALVCDEWIVSQGFTFDEAIDLRYRSGCYLYDRGHYTDAEQILTRALEACERIVPPPIDLPLICHALAVLYGRQKRYELAEPLYLRARHLWEANPGGEDYKVGCCLVNLGELYRQQKRFEEAEPLLMSALDICEQLPGMADELAANALNNLAAMRVDQGRYEEAETTHRKVYDITCKLLGAEHPQTAISLTNIAELYGLEGRSVEAGALYRTALGIAERGMGEEHPIVAAILNMLGGLYRDTGQLEEAEPVLKRAYGIILKTFGPANSQTIEYRKAYAAVLTDLGKEAEAATLLETEMGYAVVQQKPERVQVA